YTDEHFTAYEPRIGPTSLVQVPSRSGTSSPRANTPPAPAVPAGPPKLPTYEGSVVPPGVTDRAAWADAERFMRTTVTDNIERYRKADVTFQILDATGQPL